jgi:hypothetical protein
MTLPIQSIPVSPERGYSPDNRSTPDDLHLMVLLWQRQTTRDVALDLADANRKAATK